MKTLSRKEIVELNLQIFINSPIGKTEIHTDPVTGVKTERLKWWRVPFPEFVHTENGYLEMWVPQFNVTDGVTDLVQIDPSNPPSPPEEMETEASLVKRYGNICVVEENGFILMITDIKKGLVK